jgi:hypothetical protein
VDELVLPSRRRDDRESTVVVCGGGASVTTARRLGPLAVAVLVGGCGTALHRRRGDVKQHWHRGRHLHRRRALAHGGASADSKTSAGAGDVVAAGSGHGHRAILYSSSVDDATDSRVAVLSCAVVDTAAAAAAAAVVAVCGTIAGGVATAR